MKSRKSDKVRVRIYAGVPGITLNGLADGAFLGDAVYRYGSSFFILAWIEKEL